MSKIKDLNSNNSLIIRDAKSLLNLRAAAPLQNNSHILQCTRWNPLTPQISSRTDRFTRTTTTATATTTITYSLTKPQTSNNNTMTSQPPPLQSRLSPQQNTTKTLSIKNQNTPKSATISWEIITTTKTAKCMKDI